MQTAEKELHVATYLFSIAIAVLRDSAPGGALCVTTVAAGEQVLGRAKMRKKGTREASGPREGVYVERRWGRAIISQGLLTRIHARVRCERATRIKSDNFVSSFCLYCHKRSGYM